VKAVTAWLFLPQWLPNCLDGKAEAKITAVAMKDFRFPLFNMRLLKV
jgi:hypothetical protein